MCNLRSLIGNIPLVINEKERKASSLSGRDQCLAETVEDRASCPGSQVPKPLGGACTWAWPGRGWGEMKEASGKRFGDVGRGWGDSGISWSRVGRPALGAQGGLGVHRGGRVRWAWQPAPVFLARCGREACAQADSCSFTSGFFSVSSWKLLRCFSSLGVFRNFSRLF